MRLAGALLLLSKAYERQRHSGPRGKRRRGFGNRIAVAEQSETLPRRVAYCARHAEKVRRNHYPAKSRKVGRGLRINALLRDFPVLADKQLSEVDTPELVAWRDAWLKVVSASVMVAVQCLLRWRFDIYGRFSNAASLIPSMQAVVDQ